jgi:hypothetical protein
MSSKQKWKNIASSTLAAPITNVATVADIGTGDGVKFPTTADGFFKVKITDGTNYEIVKVTTRATDQFSVMVRGQESTTARAWPTGTSVSLVATTQETLERFSQLDSDELVTGTKTLQGPNNYAASAGTDTYTCTFTPAPTALVTGAKYRVLFGNTNTSNVPTLNPNALGAKKLYNENGGGIDAGALKGIREVVYDSTLDTGTGGFRVIGLRSRPLEGFTVLDTGTADALVVTPLVPWTSYETKRMLAFRKSNLANTVTNPTVNVSGLGAVTLYDQSGSALIIGALKANMFIIAEYDSTLGGFRCIGVSSSGVAQPLGVVACGGVNLPQAATRYLSVVGGAAATTEANVSMSVQYPTTVSSLIGLLSSAVPVGQSIVVTLRKNAADTALTFTIGAGATTGQDLTNSVFFEKGDLIAVKVVTSATFGATNDIGVSFIAKLFGTSIGSPLGLSFNSGGGTPSNAHSVGNWGTNENNNTKSRARFPVRSCVLTNFACTRATGGMAFGIYKNGTLLGSALASVSENANFIYAFDGSVDDFLLFDSNANFDGNCWVLPNDVFGVLLPYAPMLFNNQAQTQGTTKYFGGYIGGSSSTEADVNIPMPACTVSGLRVKIDSALTGAETAVITVRKNGVDTTLTVTLTSADTGLIKIDSTHSVVFASGDKLTISCTLSSASGTHYLNATLETFP